MKRSMKVMSGATLLEIMLVLAIAAMIVVMSIRYYQSASMSQKINNTLDAVTAVTAAGESYLAANGTLASISAAGVAAYLPGGVMPSSPWGGLMTVTAIGVNSYSTTVPSVPAAACTPLTSLLQQNSKFSVNCSAGSAVITITE